MDDGFFSPDQWSIHYLSRQILEAMSEGHWPWMIKIRAELSPKAVGEVKSALSVAGWDVKQVASTTIDLQWEIRPILR